MSHNRIHQIYSQFSLLFHLAFYVISISYRLYIPYMYDMESIINGPMEYFLLAIKYGPYWSYENLGYIDVGDKWSLVTQSWWQFLDVSDRISILVTSFGCWCPTLMLKDRGCWWQKQAKTVLAKPSPTSQSCR